MAPPAGASTDQLSSSDYEYLYEHTLLQYKQANELVKSDPQRRTAAQLIAVRAARIGVLMQASNVPAATELLESIQIEMDNDSATESHVSALRTLLPAPTRPRSMQSAAVDVDAFFEEYPHCARPTVEQDESSDDEEEDVKRPATKIATKNVQSQTEFSYTQPHPKSSAEFAAVPPRQVPLMQPNPPITTAYQSWDDHRSQNPFQTAREYARAGRGNDSAPKERAPPPPAPRGYNPYTAAPPPVPPPPEQPAIRESLKRKFQPPKRVPNESSATTSGNRPAAGHHGTAQRSASNDKEEEADELPEELKRFGKELVGKIEDEIMDCGDPVTFGDIAGLEDVKQTVQEVVCWPMKRPDLFTGLRRAPNAVLLYGPPGTGKTLIGKAIAHESGATFFSISSSSLTSKWIGEGEKLVRTMFAVAAYREPAVCFIDEIDSLLTQRKADENEASRRIKTEFLVQLDGTGTSGQGRVLIIGATNRPQELDEAARRRFTKRLYIPLPEEGDRECLLNVLLEKNHHQLTPDDIKRLAKETAGFSGADLKALSADAAMGPIRGLGAKALEVAACDVPPITYKHFRRALRGTRPSVAPSDLVHYVEWDKAYGSRRLESQIEEEEDDDL